jgi:hypothetical protein
MKAEAFIQLSSDTQIYEIRRRPDLREAWWQADRARGPQEVTRTRLDREVGVMIRRGTA